MFARLAQSACVFGKCVLVRAFGMCVSACAPGTCFLACAWVGHAIYIDPYIVILYGASGQTTDSFMHVPLHFEDYKWHLKILWNLQSMTVKTACFAQHLFNTFIFLLVECCDHLATMNFTFPFSVLRSGFKVIPPGKRGEDRRLVVTDTQRTVSTRLRYWPRGPDVLPFSVCAKRQRSAFYVQLY